MIRGLLARLLQLASVVICLIVIASFVVFGVDQTSSASTIQQKELNAESVPQGTVGGAPGSRASTSHESALDKALDDVSGELTSPFSGITSGSPHEWVVHIVNLVLALVVYGFGLGYLSRVLRLRV